MFFTKSEHAYLNTDVFTVVVEGNIGCGKSSFLKTLDNLPNAQIFLEPVSRWQNYRNCDILELMYVDPRRWSFMFQSYVQLTMLQNHVAPSCKPLKIMERSIFSAHHCFAQNLFQSGTLSAMDFDILKEWFETITNKWNLSVDLFVYLRADPKVCSERIAARNRVGESEIPLAYLEQLHRLHDQWLVEKTTGLSTPVLVLDANKDQKSVLRQFRDLGSELCSRDGNRLLDELATLDLGP